MRNRVNKHYLNKLSVPRYFRSHSHDSLVKQRVQDQLNGKIQGLADGGQQAQGGFTDLTNQFAVNITNVNK